MFEYDLMFCMLVCMIVKFLRIIAIIPLLKVDAKITILL